MMITWEGDGARSIAANGTRFLRCKIIENMNSFFSFGRFRTHFSIGSQQETCGQDSTSTSEQKPGEMKTLVPVFELSANSNGQKKRLIDITASNGQPLALSHSYGSHLTPEPYPMMTKTKGCFTSNSLLNLSAC